MSNLLGSGLNGDWNHIDDQFQQELKNITEHKDRAKLLADPDCPLWLLKGALELDTHFIVLHAAANNPRCRPEFLPVLQQRFNWPEDFWEILESQAKAEEESYLENQTAYIRSSATLEDLKNNLQNLDASISLSTKKFDWSESAKSRVAMICAPSWGIAMAPYNIGKLTGVLRKNNYDVRVYDPNIDCYHHILNVHKEQLWHGDRAHEWCSKELFNSNIFPKIKNYLDLVITDIIESKIKVVGFTTYDTNIQAIMYMAGILRRLVPDICIIAGGPLATDLKGYWFKENCKGLFNYIFIGEAEDSLIEILDNLPEVLPFEQDVGTIYSRLDLNQYPYTDYDDYDLSLYTSKGISLELSRGCIAKCSFCAETTRWKYRSVAPIRTVEEIKYQVDRHKIEHVWFVDSLINGNLKEFQELIDLLIESNVKISWTGQARCNGNMTEEFFHKIKKSGCAHLYFGVESASQRVLDDMIKKVHVWEIEQNLRDCRLANLHFSTFWMTGFVTETPIDVLHGYEFLYNQRNTVNEVLSGTGFGPTPLSDTDTNWRAYKFAWNNNVGDNKFLGDWYTTGYTNTVVHRFLRVKLTNVWLNIIKNYCHNPLMQSGNTYYSENVKYTLDVGKSIAPHLERDNYVNLNQSGPDSLSTSLANEYLPMVYALYRVFGSYRWEINCDPTEDHAMFGDLLARRYQSSVVAESSTDGDYKITISHKLDHSNDVEVNFRNRVNYIEERKREDMSFEDDIVIEGNFKTWISKELQIGESVHPQFRRSAWMMKTV